MTRSVIVQTAVTGSQEAGRALGEQVAHAFPGEAPDAIILFASAIYDYSVVLRELSAACAPRVLVGCSSAGEFTGSTPSGSRACGIAIRSDDLAFGVGVGKGLTQDRSRAAREMVQSFRGTSETGFNYRSVLLLTDALAGYTEEFLEHLTVATAGRYQVFGGGAGDDAKFSRTHVFCGQEALNDAAIGLEILSNKPLGIGVSHGWEPASEPMLVTEAQGARLVSLNAISATEMFEDHAAANGQTFDKANPLPYFLHNIIGIQTPDGYKLRVPLSLEADGAVVCAAEVPVGATVCIMKTSNRSATEAAERAASAALQQLAPGGTPAMALFFDCAATRLRMGEEFESEISGVAETLQSTQFVGCNTYGQVARVDGQFSGFHNCTAVICIIPE